MNKHLILLTVLSAMFISCTKTELDLGGYIQETEPNEMTYQATEIETGNLYAAEISLKDDNEADTDLFKIWRPAGTEITIEMESGEKDFLPYIGHTDNLGHSEFVTFPSPGKYRSVFMTSVDGWQYFEVGDMRNTNDAGQKYGGFNYYFRVFTQSICDISLSFDTLSAGESLDRSFDKSVSGSDIVELDIPENGIYQFRITSETLESDKSTFIFNCDSGESAAGNDDEDYYSNLMNPLIYSKLESNLRYLAVTVRLLTQLDSEGPDEYTLSLTGQLPESELEPNNIYNYANITGKEIVSGSFSGESQIVLGETSDDPDWFRYDFIKGHVVEISLNSEKGSDISAEFCAGTYPVTGVSIIPLRFSNLSGNETHHVNMMMPFTGTAYLMLSGKDDNYKFSVSDEGIPETLLQFNGSVHKTIETPDCGWAFYKWNMPEGGDLFEVEASGDEPVGIHVFSKDFLPYAFSDPENINRIFIRRYEKTETLYLGVYLENCEQNSEDVINFKVIAENTSLTDWNGGFSTDPVVVVPGSYSGHFDTDNYFVENNFELNIENDGILYVSTAPDRRNTSFNIDTVVKIFKDDEVVAENDDMIDFINYNKYSKVTLDVKKGETYTIQVKPFMTESSSIPAMNIIGNYILDIIIK